jgi:cytochrome oxidase Cu insertion factor (SCO1/SenC/PrrC family)
MLIKLKIMKTILVSVCALLFGFSAFAQPPAGDANPGDIYGDKVKAKGAVELTKIVSQLENGTQMDEAKIKAKIIDVCPNKGCWLKLELPDGKQAMVKMKDYGFFVPLAAKGKTVVIEGQASMKTVSVKELRHYAEDAKKPQSEIDAITEPKKEVNITAKGIVVIG